MSLRTLLLGIAVILAGIAIDIPRDAAAQTTGTISGTVSPSAPRRTANRYPGGAQAPNRVQPVPAVMFLKGRVEGPPPPGWVAAPRILQKDTTFSPAAVVVTVGGTVAFPNDDPFFHNVFSFSGTKRFDLGRYPEGESKDVVFDRPGTVEVFCEVHAFMRGVIVVTESPYHAIAGPDGRFRMDGVPPGTYTLVAWHPDHEALEQQVKVTAGADTRVEVELRR